MMPQAGCGLVPPHEMMGKRIGDFLPEQRALRKFSEDSYLALRARFPRERACFWLWGAGTACELPDFSEKTDFPEQRSLPRASSKDWPWPQDLSSFPCPGPMEAWIRIMEERPGRP